MHYVNNPWPRALQQINEFEPLRLAPLFETAVRHFPGAAKAYTSMPAKVQAVVPLGYAAPALFHPDFAIAPFNSLGAPAAAVSSAAEPVPGDGWANWSVAKPAVWRKAARGPRRD